MAFSSRLTNIIASYAPAIGRAGTRRQVEKYRSSNGRKGSTFLGTPCFLLDVVGRRSGKPHPVMLIHVPRGDDLIVVGSGAGVATTPNWYKNLWRPAAATCRWVLIAGGSWRASFATAPSATSAGR
jgi:deazaflavin-dependent oxidoreductase (nitroreductase family)